MYTYTYTPIYTTTHIVHMEYHYSMYKQHVDEALTDIMRHCFSDVT